MAKKRRYIKLGVLEDENGLVRLIAIPWTFWLTWDETRRFRDIIKEKTYTAILLEPGIKKEDVCEGIIWEHTLQSWPLFAYGYENWKELEKMEITRFEGGPKELTQD